MDIGEIVNRYLNSKNKYFAIADRITPEQSALFGEEFTNILEQLYKAIENFPNSPQRVNTKRYYE